MVKQIKMTINTLIESLIRWNESDPLKYPTCQSCNGTFMIKRKILCFNAQISLKDGKFEKKKN